MMDILFTIVTAVLSSGMLVWVSQEWISARLRSSIQHEYDKQMETLKADLSRQATFQATAYASFAEGQKAAMERKLKAVDYVWSSLIDFRRKLPAILGFVDLLTVDEYKKAKDDPTFVDLFEDLSEDKIINLSPWDIEDVRPYVGEYLWSLIFVYRAVFLRTTLLLFMGRIDVKKMEWYKDEGIQKLLDASLSKDEMAAFDKQQFGKILWVQRQLEGKILSALHKIISGEDFISPSIEQLQRIQNVIATVKVEAGYDPLNKKHKVSA